VIEVQIPGGQSWH